MFAGIGGFRSGLTRAGGFRCVGHCEIDKYANASYQAIYEPGKEERYYLQHGRPETDCPCIFVRHLAPFDVMSGSMQRLVSKLVSKAGIHVSTDKPIGMHSFRHSVATSMLSNGAELTDIAQTLGHATPESTQVYVSLNTEMLRRCALEVLL